jgi:hypothetical protein
MPTPAAQRPLTLLTGPLLALRHAGQALFHRWPVHVLRSAPTRQVQVQTLAGILDDAVDAQPAADRAVAACGEPGFVAGSAIQAAAEQIAVYHHLMLRLRALRLANDLRPFAERASRLLAHHEWLLNQALTLVNAPRNDARLETARRQLSGLGATADDLRILRDEVRRLADRTCGEAERPCGGGAAQ